MPLPRRLARFNRVVTNRLFGLVAGRIPPWVFVEHVGRRSGRRYRAVLSAFRCGDNLVIALTYGENADWARNVVTAQWCRVQYARRWQTFNCAELVRGKAGLRLLPPFPRAVLRLAGWDTVMVLRRRPRIG
jgi:deazaflavin-dependent oxidoreductase (nitroreductase family)